MKTRSDLATQVPRPRDVDDRSAPVFGVVIHTTGSGIVEQAVKLKVNPLDHAVAYYLKPDSYFPHYVIGWDGHCVQVADERERAQHVGLSAADRQLYLSGRWKNRLATELVLRWVTRWPGFASPSALYPGPSVNNVYLGCELTPLLKRDPVYGFFTVEQHKMVAMLARDIGERHGLPSYWWTTSRLLGHEDVSPLTRSDKGGGWDPGALRAAPNFHWGYVLQLLADSARE